ncbi:MAG: phosphomethylpyrimidine synthase ThiC, partial [Candidatus Omnitrophota bacterium]
MTQLELARKNKITPLMRMVARKEAQPPEYLRDGIAKGTIVIPANLGQHIKKPCAIGKGLSTKVNANLGTSTDRPDLNSEINKLKTAIACGADTVMDLSVGGDLTAILKRLLSLSSVPLGTVPIYQAAVEAQKNKGSFLKMTGEDFLRVIEQQARLGVDF